MDWSGCELVESVAGKVSGLPILKGSRVPADAIVDNYECGESVEDIAYNFDLNPDDVRGVLTYASARQAARHAS